MWNELIESFSCKKIMAEHKAGFLATIELPPYVIHAEAAGR